MGVSQEQVFVMQLTQHFKLNHVTESQITTYESMNPSMVQDNQMCKLGSENSQDICHLQLSDSAADNNALLTEQPTTYHYDECGFQNSNQILREMEDKKLYSLKMQNNVCAQCGKSIQDRYFLSAVEKKWHIGCLLCCVCKKSLDKAGSCFSKGDNIYCKVDYFRIFGARRCSKCLASISSSELVMRAKQLVFHVSCFSCEVCNTRLTKGDQFGIKNSSILCRLHFEKPENPNNYMLMQTTKYNEPLDINTQTNIEDSGNVYPGFYNSPQIETPQQPRQKGRPRKRKHKDIERMTANLDLNTEYLELGFSRDSLTGSSRTKRMRTSFKHHQLRAMKSYFAINHNPDAKDLKQLSQKTGLPKRVLQVWFQNARAKFRRVISKQDGKPGEHEEYETYASPIRIGNNASPGSVD
ncbi:protein apterous-like [Culicoides brevitarsis]|uniref:protein apterous-like n=1 Tax=Culicoides brevitarsis TaxID=469753 RepID=UPI00307CAE9B